MTVRNVLTFFVPSVENCKNQTDILTTERRRWLSAISRDDLTQKILENNRVFGEHFYSGNATAFWGKFEVHMVPSLNLGSLGHTTFYKDNMSVGKQHEQAQRICRKDKT